MAQPGFFSSISSSYSAHVNSFNQQVYKNNSMEVDDDINYNKGYNNDTYENNFDAPSIQSGSAATFSITLGTENKRPNKNKQQPPRQAPKNDFDDLRRVLFGNDDDNWTDTRFAEQKCNNPLCDHKDFNEDPTPVTTPQIEVNGIVDLIAIGKTFHCKKNKEYNGISLRILCNLVEPLSELNDMVGMVSVKESLINQIIFFIQGFNKKTSCGKCNECAFRLPCLKGQTDMLHTVITGSPGCGKTELGKILGKVYKAMGILENGNMKIVSRSDLIGKYLGHTAAKTQDVIDSCRGGVMFIDEAYALGNALSGEGRDSFSKECLDTLNQNLSERRDFLCIIAGYKEELEKCFFSVNQGLRRRFTFRYDIDKYDSEELLDIFLLKVKKESWGIEYELTENDTRESMELKTRQRDDIRALFRDNVMFMPNFGGDIETLFLNCKIVHGKRVLFMDQNLKKILTVLDVKNGFEKFVQNRKYKEASDQEYTDISFYSS